MNGEFSKTQVLVILGIVATIVAIALGGLVIGQVQENNSDHRICQLSYGPYSPLCD